MKNNPLQALAALGQSLWLDYIRRDLMAGGELRRLIAEDGLRGMTSNPAIFEKAIVESHDYDDDIRALALAGQDAKSIYEALSRATCGTPPTSSGPCMTLPTARTDT